MPVLEHRGIFLFARERAGPIAPNSSHFLQVLLLSILSVRIPTNSLYIVAEFIVAFAHNRRFRLFLQGAL